MRLSVLMILGVVIVSTIAFDKKRISKKAIASIKKLLNKSSYFHVEGQSAQKLKRFERSVIGNLIEEESLSDEEFPLPSFFPLPQLFYQNNIRSGEAKSRRIHGNGLFENF
ncbi:hypothetical protein Tcan_09445 [Toxocara canis]|uniref:Uncharacterized protein n=1 Tax=Toxocara canis TaxID=6265 RepID=A0A0B2W4Q9_TOXCA|nr:hypothetical protein Tcan_09445 [Toxocara canis]